MKNKLNLKGQFSNSQTAVNPDSQPTVNRRSRLMSVLCLLTFLTLGTGQMWGDSTVKGGYIYFDELNSGYAGAGDMQFWAGHSSYSSSYSMSKITNTKLWYCSAPSWNDATYFAFTSGCNGWGGEGNDYYKRIGDNPWKSGKQEGYTLNSGYYYIFKVASTANKAAVNSTSPYGSQGNSHTSLNKSQTFEVQVSTDGGNTYSNPATAPATISFSSKTFSNANTCGTSSTGSLSGSTVSLSRNAGFTATTELTYSSLSSGYTFVCWHDGSSSVGTGTSYTYYPTGTNTITARFTKNFTVGDKIYLLRNPTWKNASNLNHYAAYFYGAEGNTWVNCERVGTSDYYSVTVPSGNWGYVIFVALNNASNSWDNKIYQTDDLMYDAAHNGVEIIGSNNSQSRISVYTGLSVTRNNSSYAAAPSITNSQTVVKSGSSITVNAGTETTGYHWVNWTSNKGSFGTATDKNTTFTPTASNAVATANYAINTQTVRFYGKGNTGGSMSNQVYTYGVAQALTSNAFTKTGYNFGGWATSSASADAMTVAHVDGASITLNPSTHGTYYDLYAIWTAKTYTVTLEVDEANHGNTTGATTSQSVTYNGATTTVPNRPHAANGYGFTGYYTSSGTKVINADGTWIASVAGYTDNSGNWIHDGDVTLYANYVKARISGFTFDAAAVEPSGEVGVTPIISPTPEGTMVVCWRVLYNNGNEIEPKIDVTPHPSGINNKVTFTAPATSGTYKVEATLHLGSDCEAEAWGEPAVQNFQVAGDHTVTVQYKCGSTTIKPSTTVNGKPLEWSEAITAPDDIVGYSFSKWVAVDGVTITADNGTTSVTESTSRTIRIKATYDGKLRAEYTRKNVIYFNNTLGWDDVWVYFYNSNKYWADGYGTGAWKGKTFEGNKPYWETEHGHMTRIEGTNIWYFDYTAAGYTTRPNVAFANMDKSNSTDTNEGDNSKAYFSNTTSKPIQVVRRGDHNATLPMFVPVVGQTAVKLNSNKAEYYSNGYWMNYPENTGYTLKIYNQPTVDGAVELRSIPFEFTEDKNMPMTLTVNLETGKTYGFKIYRADNRYYGNNGTMTVNTTNWAMTEKVENTNTANCGLKTTAAGDYIFTLNYFDVSSVYEYRVGVTYPVAMGDYQVVYKDDTMSEWFKSDILPKANEADTVSFFVRKDKRPILKLQKCTAIGTGTVTWTDTVDNLLSEGIPAAITKDSVYNFIFAKAATGKLQHTNTEGYTGNYYIRTDCAGATKWDNYRAADHMMTYSEYSERNSDYTHYFMSHIWSGVNVKYVVANDYSPNISDTLIRSSYRGGDASHVDENGNILAEANIRFMWNKNNNAVYRAYLSGGKEDGSKFLVLRGTNSDNIKSQAGEVLTGDSKANPGNNHGAGAHCMQFTDDENWIYETTVQVLPSSYVKLFAKFNGEHYFYYKGNDNDLFNDTKIDGIPNAIQLITGTGSDYVKVRVIYDFKTDRLLAAYLPSGNISTPMPINADVMFIREHQGDIDQLTFSKASEESPMGAITKIKTAYAVMRFNKWTLNNKSTINSGTKETPVHLPLASPLSRYERDVFYVSFPFDVNLNEVFGFGTYGVHWIMEYYDGAARAANGFWKDTPSYWRFITNRNGYVLKKNVGYILALDLDELGEESSVWANNNERAELFFPSSGTMPDIKSGTVTAELDEHTCTIVRNGSDRTKADSHWNIMGVPTYINTTNISYANTEWTNKIGPKFLYTWNSADNTLTPTTATGFTYHAMHAYTVQYYGNVTWTTSVSPSSIVARQKQEPNAYEWCLELQQNDQMTDRTYVRMSDEEEVTSGFEFGYDMSKSMNQDKANIYTFIGSETVAGNSLPLQTEQTTVVPVGVTIKNAGEYTFAMPEGTNGVGVTLVDTEANVRTSLSALDYTVSLEAGEYTGRFMLEISPITQTPTDIEAVSVQPSEVRKVMIDGILYIVKDGKMYDARGARVE